MLHGAAMSTVAIAPAAVTGRDPPLAAKVPAHTAPVGEQTVRRIAGSDARRLYVARPARFKALIATLAIHVLVAALAIYGWHRSGQLAPRHDAVVVTLPTMPDRPAHQRKPGMEEPAPQPSPATPEFVPPAVVIPPLKIAAVEPLLQPLAGAEGGVESQLAQVTQAYRHAVTTRLAAQRYYPQEALLRRYEGTGKILFRIDRNGRLLEVAIRTSTGWQVLDRAAVDQVRRAAPFPPIPDELPDELVVSLPLEFLILGGHTMVAAR